jgi:hypothetical protein
MTFWMGVMCGIWVGAPVGFVVAAILAAAKNTDRDMGIE